MMAQEVLYRSDVAVESLPPEDDTAISLYMTRYTQLLPADCLANFKVGVYQHSAVGREVLIELLTVWCRSNSFRFFVDVCTSGYGGDPNR